MYWVYRYGQRHVLAVPGGKHRIRAAGVAAIPAHTSLSRFYKLFLERTVAAGLDRLIVTEYSTPVPRIAGFRWDAFVDLLAGVLARHDFETVVVQPPQSRRNRFYVHAFSTLGTRLAFAKVSSDTANDCQLERESQVLCQLEGAAFESFRYPAMLASGSFDGRRYHVVGPLPQKAVPSPARWTNDIEAIHKEIATGRTTAESQESLTWWPEFLSRAAQVPELAASLFAASHSPAAICRAHGDFTQWNLFVAAGTWWLFDWESHAVDAPVLADRLRFHLGLKTRLVAKRPREVAELLRAQFRCLNPERNLEFMRALAFLHARGVAAATAIGRVWSDVSTA